MKNTMLAIAKMSLMMSLITTCATTGLGQGKARARVKPPTGGEQICTGCCDPCYSDDWWKVHQPSASTNSAKTAKPVSKARKGKH